MTAVPSIPFHPLPSLSAEFVEFGPNLPKDLDEQPAYRNVWYYPTSVATWQGYLTGISNPITRIWIIADAPDKSEVKNALIFTSSTNNPVNDYNNIHQNITGGASLTLTSS